MAISPSASSAAPSTRFTTGTCVWRKKSPRRCEARRSAVHAQRHAAASRGPRRRPPARPRGDGEARDRAATRAFTSTSARRGARPGYTFDTLTELRRELGASGRCAAARRRRVSRVRDVAPLARALRRSRTSSSRYRPGFPHRHVAGAHARAARARIRGAAHAASRSRYIWRRPAASCAGDRGARHIGVDDPRLAGARREPALFASRSGSRLYSNQRTLCTQEVNEARQTG